MPTLSLAPPALYGMAAEGFGDVSLTAGCRQGEHWVWLPGETWEGKAFPLTPSQYVPENLPC